MTMFSSHLQAAKSELVTANVSVVTHTTGICFWASDKIASSNDLLIIDSGASRYICYCYSLFLNWRRVHGVTVVPPTSFSVQVEFVGDVRISEHLTLTNVLFVLIF